MLLTFIFIIKLVAQINIFNYLKLKHGRITLSIIRKLEQSKYKLVKIKEDIKFIKTCQTDNLKPKFTRINVAINNNRKLQQRIRKLILQTELNNKHTEKRILLKEIRVLSNQLRLTLSTIEFNALQYRLTKQLTEKRKYVAGKLQQKLKKLYTEKSTETLDKSFKYIKQVVHNFSNYQLTPEENIALSFGLDQHIPTKINKLNLRADFESFYQNLLKNISPMTDEDKQRIKAKISQTFDNYSKIKVPFKQRQIIQRLKDRTDIVIMKQDKGRGVVIINRDRYVDKCLQFLSSPQFKKSDEDQTSLIEGQVQRALRKIKSHLPEGTYYKLYPTGSSPGKFYGQAKIHKLKESEGVNELPIRPIISNIGTATYQTAKYLSNLLQPLAKSEYTIESTKTFIETLRTKVVLDNHKLVSFDVKSLFTNVPLETTINIILKRIYVNKEIKTGIPKKELKTLLLLCTQSVQFYFNGDLYTQIDGVAMGSPLGPVLANIFMVELEKLIVPVTPEISFWYRYVDDTICFIKNGSLKRILQKLNNFHKNIEFTFEEENNFMIAFLDVLIVHRPDKFDTAVFRKETNTNIYLHWSSFAPDSWKKGTLKVLVSRAFALSSTDYFLKMELDFLTETFVEINGYPKWLVYQTIKLEKEKRNAINITDQISEIQNDSQHKNFQLVVPYQGKKGESIMKRFTNTIVNTFPETKVRVTYTSTRLSSQFNLKDKTPFEHQHNVVYKAKCPDCNHTYVGETGRRLAVRVEEHAETDKTSQVYRHSRAKQHTPVNIQNFEILGSGYKNYFLRKIAESVFIKEHKPILNKQNKSVPIFLFT